MMIDDFEEIDSISNGWFFFFQWEMMKMGRCVWIDYALLTNTDQKVFHLVDRPMSQVDVLLFHWSTDWRGAG